RAVHTWKITHQAVAVDQFGSMKGAYHLLPMRTRSFCAMRLFSVPSGLARTELVLRLVGSYTDAAKGNRMAKNLISILEENQKLASPDEANVFFNALRAGDLETVRRMATANPKILQWRHPSFPTILHQAAESS